MYLPYEVNSKALIKISKYSKKIIYEHIEKYKMMHSLLLDYVIPDLLNVIMEYNKDIILFNEELYLTSETIKIMVEWINRPYHEFYGSFIKNVTINTNWDYGSLSRFICEGIDDPILREIEQEWYDDNYYSLIHVAHADIKKRIYFSYDFAQLLKLVRDYTIYVDNLFNTLVGIYAGDNLHS